MRWIFQKYYSDGDTPSIYKFDGDIENAKDILIAWVKDDRKSELDSYEFGTENKSEISECNGMLCAFSVFREWDTNFVAMPVKEINQIPEYI